MHGRVEEDLSGRDKSVLAGWFAACLVAVCIVTFGLTVWFRFALDEQRSDKVRLGPASELSRYRQHVRQVLAGKKGLVEGATPIAIDEAIRRFVRLQRDSMRR